MSRRPNLLLVFADQMRGTAMGCAGNVDARTPTMDRLAAEGMTFPRAYANCPVCTPSRGTLLTGRHAHAHGALVNDVPLSADRTSLAHLLGRSGYRTGYVGKWHLDGVPRDRFTPPGPRRFGFEFWAAWNCAHDYFGGRVYRDTPEPVRLEGYEPVGQTDLALEFMAARDERPWCLVLSWGPPHNPYGRVPEKYTALYDPESLTLRPNVPVGEIDEVRARGELAGYYAHITALDEQLGRLLAALEAAGRADDTIVLFTSDHGDMLWSQGTERKQKPWEESIRVPLLVRWPGRVPAGAAPGTLVSIVDLVPTLLGLMDVSPPEDLDGSNLAAVFRGETARGAGPVFLQELVTADEGLRTGVREWRGVRTERHTFARFVDGEPWVLYDNAADPYQTENLAGSAAHADLHRRLMAELDRHIAATGDPHLGWAEIIRAAGLVDLWNARERHMHPDRARLLEETSGP